MEIRNTVLLIFEDQKEIHFFESNLAENNFRILKGNNVNEGLELAKAGKPDLVVLNILLDKSEIIKFSESIKSYDRKDVFILSLVEEENYFNSNSVDHLIVNPVRPKLLLSILRGLMNKEDISWLPAICY